MAKTKEFKTNTISVKENNPQPNEIDTFEYQRRNYEQKNGIFRYFGSLIDDAETLLPADVSGWGFVQIGDGEEYAQFSFTSAGVVTLINNSTNVEATDTDANLCVYDGGSQVAIKNRLGATKTIKILVNYI